MFYKIVYNDASYWISSYIGLFQLDLQGNFLSFHPIRTNEFEFDYQDRLIKPIPYSSLDIVKDLASFKSNTEDYNAKRYDRADPNTPVNVTSFIKSKGKIYMSTLYKGLIVFENDIFTSLNEKGLLNELEINHLSLINESNTLIISTVSGEVYLADISDDFKITKKINKEQIRGNSILFLETYKNYILVGTNEGLNIYKNDSFRFIDDEQGLKNVNFTTSKVIGNKLIIGTEKGYYEVKLDEILNTKFQALKLSITDIKVNHKLYKKDDFKWFKYITNELALNHNQNVLSIDYKVSNHPYPNKLFYSFQANGLDEKWSKYSNKSTIHLPYLPSGKFGINVKVKDLNSGVITTSKLMNITVSPPFWKTCWFLLSLFIIVGVSILFIYKNRVNNIKKRETQKSVIQKRLVETKMEALQSQMNPHFTFNAMNSIQNYIIDNDIDNALMYLGEFAKLIRKTLDNSSQAFITLAEEISYLKSYTSLENMRFNNKVQVSFDYKNVPIQEVDIPPMLIQPFVENAFVHAFSKEHNNPKLSINFSVKDEILTCKIIDNGSGMSDTTSGQIHQSKGLKLVSERLNLLNKSQYNKYEVQSKIGEGTIVNLQIHLL